MRETQQDLEVIAVLENRSRAARLPSQFATQRAMLALISSFPPPPAAASPAARRRAAAARPPAAVLATFACTRRTRWATAAEVELSEPQRRYLFSVMRATAGDTLSVFNGADGEWRVRIEALDKKRGVLRAEELQRAQPADAPSPSLYFAVLKGARLPALVAKATELGVGALQPVVTRHCAARDLNAARLNLVAIEAAEQCGRLTVPTVREPVALPKCWPAGTPKRLCLCATSAATARRPLEPSARRRARRSTTRGRFSPEEFEALDALAAARRVSLGANILRAETAALAALAVVACGR